jgi:hypothetical protein
MRTRTLPANSSSIAGSPHSAALLAVADLASGGAINTCANPSAMA